MKRVYQSIVLSALITLIFGLLAGCTSFMRLPKNDQEHLAEVEIPKTVGEATRPHGLGVASVEAVGLVTGLSNTGSDPRLSQQRQMLIEEMKRRNVDNPHQQLADPTTALVLVQAKLPPGVKKGDRLDVQVRAPLRSETTSLAGGWLMEAQLREVAVLDDSLRSGHVRAVSAGPVLIDALMADDSAGVSEVRGTVLGGCVATQSRPVGLHLRSEHHNVSMSKLVGKAVNQRFDVYVGGKRRDAAIPKTDQFIELEVHPRYRNNLIRFLRVIEQIPLREENQLQQIARVKELESDLLVPATASLAALRLEAIGKDAIKTLLSGLQSESEEVRFYAAEALAYLDQEEAAKHLAEATQISAFRARAFTALGAMSNVEAHDALSKLLHTPSAETRYGAFRALQEMNPRDLLLGQELLSPQIAFHQIDSDAPPMVHVRRRERPEIAVFGAKQSLNLPLMVVVDKSIIVKDAGQRRIRVTRYKRTGEDETIICPATVEELIRALIKMEASYPDIVTVLQKTKEQGALPARLEFDAIAEVGRNTSAANRTHCDRRGHFLQPVAVLVEVPCLLTSIL